MSDTTGRGALVFCGLAAILVSTCCLGPLVLIMVGISGAWIANLTALEPYRPIFIGVAAVALFFSYRRIFRPAVACRGGGVRGPRSPGDVQDRVRAGRRAPARLVRLTLCDTGRFCQEWCPHPWSR